MRLQEFSLINRALILFIGMVMILSFPTTLLRLASVDFFVEYYFDLVFAAFVGLALLNLVLTLKAPLPERFLAVLLLSFILLIFAIGVLRSTDDPIGGLRYFVLPLVVYFLLIGRNFLLFFITSKRFWAIIMISHALGLAVYFSGLMGPIYPGIGVQSIAYASIFFIVNGHPILFLISLVMIFFEGKRSILFSILVTLAFLKLVKFSVAGRLLYSIVAGILASLLLIVFLYSITDAEGSTTLARINYINPFSDQFDLYLGSSGRFGELVSFWEGKSFLEVLFGAGSGFKYQWDLGFASEQSGEIKGYLHMSIANYLAVGGILGLALFVYLAILPFKASRLKLPPKAQMTAFGFGIFSIVQSFFGFNLATDATSLIFIIGPAALLSVQGYRRYSPQISDTSLETKRSIA